MDLDQVSGLHQRYFLAVVQHGSVAGAARALGVAQPSLSEQIRLLEKRVGARLFDRSSTGMTPTPAGVKLVEAAEAWLAAMGALSTERQPSRVGVPRGMDSQAIALLHDRLGADVVLVPCDTSQATSSIRRRLVDAAVVREPIPHDLPDLRVEELVTRPLGVLTSTETMSTLPLTGDGRVLIANLQGRALVWFDETRAPGFAAMILDELRAADWNPELLPVDPASTTITEDALTHQPGLVMLRPEPESLSPRLTWAPLDPPIHETLSILRRR